MHGGDPIWLVLRLYREFLSRNDASASDVEALVYEICALIARHPGEDAREPSWLSGIDRAVSERFHEPIDIAAMAREAGVHPSHLCRAFRRFRGHTVTEALFGARVQHVARRLAESDDSLPTIACDAGFADQSHMTRIFKRVTGYPPGEHRRNVRA